MNANLAMYYAQQEMSRYQPLIREGLQIWDPLVKASAYTAIGRKSITWAYQAPSDSILSEAELRGVKCQCLNLMFNIGTFNARLASIDSDIPVNVDSGPLTISVWTFCIGLATDNSSYRSSFGIGGYDSAVASVATRFLFYTPASLMTTGRQLRFDVGAAGGKTDSSSSNTEYITNGEWMNFAVVYNGTRITAYVNGQEFWYTNRKTRFLNDRMTIVSGIGSGLSAARNLYVFNRALSTAEITQLAGETL